jgi:formate hydrogenlyase subunit 3/multisubunit Na+/H+ antiporter MnhD subunit
MIVVLSKTFNILSLLSAIIALIYIIYSWYDYSNKSNDITQLLLMNMFVFGGLAQVLSKNRIGMLLLAVAFLIASSLFIKFAW